MDDRAKTLRSCDACILAERCRKYTPQGLCAYGLAPHSIDPHPSQTPQRLQEIQADLLEVQYDRVMQGVLGERTDAAGMDKDTTKNIELLHKMIKEGHDMLHPKEQVMFKAEGPGVLDMFKQARDP